MIASTVNRNAYVGTGSVGPFAFNFQIFAYTDLRVVRTSALGVDTTLAYVTDFTATGAGDVSGTVTLVTALAVGETLTIRRVRPLTQARSIRNGGPYFAATHEDAWDDLTMQVQQLYDEVQRSVRVKEAVDPSTLAMTLRGETGKVIGWDSPTTITNKTLDANAVALPGNGRSVATLSAYLDNNKVANVLDYYVVGDANDSLMFQRAHDALAAIGKGGIVRAPSRPGGYNFGASTVTFSGSGIRLECDSFFTGIAYSGTGYAVKFDAGGVNTINFPGGRNISVSCSNAAGGAIYAARTMYGYFDNCYAENTQANSIASGMVLDGTGHFCTNTVFFKCRSSNFKYQYRWMGGVAGTGYDIHTDCALMDCFGNAGAVTAGNGSCGLYCDSGASECFVMRGNFESVDYGIRFVVSPGGTVPVNNAVDHVRFEAIFTKHWSFPANSSGNTVIAPKHDGNAAKIDEPLSGVRIDALSLNRLPALQFVKKAIACVNGNNNHTLAIGLASLVVISGPTLTFSIGGFAGGAAAIDGQILHVINLTVQSMTINNNDPLTAANCSIRTGTGANVTIGTGVDTNAATFIYSADYLQWILVSHQP